MSNTDLHNSALVPFHRTDAVYWTSNDCRDLKSFGYTYPELGEWNVPNVSRVQLRTKVAATIRTLYANQTTAGSLLNAAGSSAPAGSPFISLASVPGGELPPLEPRPAAATPATPAPQQPLHAAAVPTGVAPRGAPPAAATSPKSHHHFKVGDVASAVSKGVDAATAGVAKATEAAKAAAPHQVRAAIESVERAASGPLKSASEAIKKTAAGKRNPSPSSHPSLTPHSLRTQSNRTRRPDRHHREEQQPP